jgi:hypothetical protein
MTSLPMGTYGSIDNAFAPVLEDDSHDMINEDFKLLSFELCGYDVIDYQCADPIELESLAPTVLAVCLLGRRASLSQQEHQWTRP